MQRIQPALAVAAGELPPLDVIAAFLEGLEETIIHKLIDRAQFARNPKAYARGLSGFTGEDESLFELRLRAQEEIDARFGRFLMPEERPFTRNLPNSRRELSQARFPLCIDNFDRINLGAPILRAYLAFLDGLCAGGDDGHYGSSVEHDVFALQALARRIHYGSFYVAESKYRGAPEQYQALAADGDTAALEGLLTRPEVELRIIDRVKTKVASIQAAVRADIRYAVQPETIAQFYRQTIIPLTKQGEVAYLLARKPQ